jgi:hypothetical protein
MYVPANQKAVSLYLHRYIVVCARHASGTEVGQWGGDAAEGSGLERPVQDKTDYLISLHRLESHRRPCDVGGETTQNPGK